MPEAGSSLPISKGGGWGIVSDIIGMFSSGGKVRPAIGQAPWAQVMQRRFAPSSQPAPPAPSTPGGQVALPSVIPGGFDPFGAMASGLSKAREVLQDLYPTLYMIQMIRQLFGGTPNRTGWDYGYPTSYPGGVGGPAPIPYPPAPAPVYVPPAPAYPTSTPAAGTTGGETRMYSFYPDVSGGGGFLQDLTGLAYGIGGLVSAFNQPAVSYPTVPTVTQPSSSWWNIPGIDIRSPVQLESTTATQNACAVAMSPWQQRATSGVSPKMHIQVNPATGQLVHFAPVRITGVKPFNTGIRRRRRCCSGKR